MKQPSAKFNGLNNNADLIKAFSAQMRDFARAIATAARGAEKMMISPESQLDTFSFQAQIHAISERFSIHVRLFDHVVGEVKQGSIIPAQGWHIIKLGSYVLWALCNTHRAQTSKLRNLLSSLMQMNSKYPGWIVAIHGAARPASAEDNLSWETFLQQEVTALVWNPEELYMHGFHRPPRPVSDKEIWLTASQQIAMQVLDGFWHLKLLGKERVAGISVRPYPLIIAPSGTGKTALVRAFAERREVTFVPLDSGAWILNGAYSKPATLTLLRDYVNKYDRGIILIDELDKFSCNSGDWWRSVQQEVYSLLDGRLQWSDQEIKKLRENWLIVGCATFQELHRRQGRQLGFTAPSKNDGIQSELHRQVEIPEELLARFNCEHVHLAPPSEADFRDRIAAIHAELEQPILPEIEMDALVAQALQSQQNARWLEVYAGRLLMESV